MKCKFSKSEKIEQIGAKNGAVPLFSGGFEQIAHHFNENCLTISNFYSKSKSDKFSSIGVIFKVRNQKFASVQLIFVGF